MKKTLLQLASLLIAFILGSVVTYVAMTKQQMDALMQARTQAKQTSATVAQESALTNTPDIDLDKDQELETNHTNQSLTPNLQASLQTDAKDPQSLSIDDYSEDEAKAIVDSMPNYVLEQYIDKFMAKGLSEEIGDSRRFAERAIEELYQSNDTQVLDGEIRLSLDTSMPDTSINTDTVNKNSKLYAHLDTFGKVPQSPYVFVKWVDNSTGQILLFEKKDIIADSQQNWVSFQPYEGWHTGSYDIRFYQFTSELQPIAQLTYHISQVNES